MINFVYNNFFTSNWLKCDPGASSCAQNFSLEDLSFVNVRFSRCNGCEITVVIRLIYVLTYLPRPFTSSLFLPPLRYSHYFLSFFFILNRFRKPPLPQDYEFWKKNSIDAKRSDEDSLSIFLFFGGEGRISGFTRRENGRNSPRRDHRTCALTLEIPRRVLRAQKWVRI